MSMATLLIPAARAADATRLAPRPAAPAARARLHEAARSRALQVPSKRHDVTKLYSPTDSVPVPLRARPNSPARLAASMRPRVLAPTAVPQSDLGAAENVPAQRLTLVSPFDDPGSVAGLTNGKLCVMGQEEYRLYALSSTDGGATFAAETTVAGGTGQSPVFEHAMTMASDGTVIAAWSVGDGNGDYGLQVARSTDAGRTWGTATSLSRRGDASFGVGTPVIAVGGNTVAVAYLGANRTHAYVAVSSNLGATWGTPVRVDAGAPASSYAPTRVDLLVDGSGTVYAAFAQDRGDGSTVWVAKSATPASASSPFPSGEKDTSASLPDTGGAAAPRLALAGNGAALVTFTDRAVAGDHLYVISMTGTPASPVFTLGLDEPLSLYSPFGFYLEPKIYTAGSTAIVLFAQKSDEFTLYTDLLVYRSGSNGAVSTWTNTSVAFTFSPDTYPNYAAAYLAGPAEWVVAWTDDYGDQTLGTLTDVYMTWSTDGGSTWDQAGLPVTNDWTFPDFTTNTTQGLMGLAPSNNTGVFFLFTDQRDDGGRSNNLWANRMTGNPPAQVASAEKRIDTDTGSNVAPASFDTPALLADKTGTVVAAFSAVGQGYYASMYAAASTDGGFTFGVPTKIGNGDPKLVSSFEPVLASNGLGNVYLAFQANDQVDFGDPSLAVRRLKFNHSTDFGKTWAASDAVVDTFDPFEVVPGAYFFDFPNVQVGAGTGNRVTALWSTQYELYAATSTNAGTSFGPKIALENGSDGSYSLAPRVCVFPGAGTAGADKLVAVYISNQPLQTTVVSKISLDGGSTWSGSRIPVRTAGAGGAAYAPLNLACDPVARKAFAIWDDDRNLIYAVHGAAYDNTLNTWTDVTVATTDSFAVPEPRAAFVSGGVLTAWEDNGLIKIARSSDVGGKGLTFNAAVRIDSDDSAFPILPQLTADAQGNAWVMWTSYTTAPYPTLLARRSPDGGATWDNAIYRLDRKTPAGNYFQSYDEFPVAASDTGAAYFTYLGWRSGRHSEPVVQAFDPLNLNRVTTVTPADGDVDNSGRIDGFDLFRVARAFGKSCGNAGFDGRTDLNKSCLVDGTDLSILAGKFGASR